MQIYLQELMVAFEDVANATLARRSETDSSGFLGNR